MKKVLLSLLTIVSSFSITAKEVEIINLTGTDLVLRKITTHDRFGYITANGIPGPVRWGYDLGATSNYNYNSNVIIIPNGQTVDLLDYTKGSYYADVNFINNGGFPFGWQSVLNPFYGKVFNYTNIGGVDTPTGSPLSLTVPQLSHPDCIKDIGLSVIGYTPSGSNFVIHIDLDHSSSDNHTKPTFDQYGYMYYTKYEHRPLTNGHYSNCARDRITVGFI